MSEVSSESLPKSDCGSENPGHDGHVASLVGYASGAIVLTILALAAAYYFDTCGFRKYFRS